MGVTIQKLEAVQCRACQRLHHAESTTYVVLNGTTVHFVAHSHRGSRIEHPIQYTNAVVCDSSGCILKVVRGTDEY